jgi:hypothetical protein
MKGYQDDELEDIGRGGRSINRSALDNYLSKLGGDD